jgi:hypothetical protein
MNKLIMTTGLLIICQSSIAQQTNPVVKPDPVTTEAKYELLPSSVFVPIEISQTLLKQLIHQATPTQQRIRDESKTEELNFSFDIKDGETKFTGNTISHHMRLTNGDGSYRRRGWTRQPWPFNGRIYLPWVRVDCDDIRGNADVDITVNLQSNYQLKATGNLSAKIDNVQCAQFNVTGIARAFTSHSFKQDLDKSLNNGLKTINIKSTVSDLWQQLQTPYRVDNDLYFLIKPSAILYQDIQFSGETATTGIGLNFYACTGNKVDSAQWKPNVALPNLTKIWQLTPTT